VLTFWRLVAEATTYLLQHNLKSEDVRILNDLMSRINHKSMIFDKETLPTFHTILHVADFVPSLGVPLNYHSGRQESLHKLLKKDRRHSDNRATSYDLLKKANQRASLQYIVHGGKWGKDREHEASAVLKDLVRHPGIRILPLFTEQQPVRNFLMGEPQGFFWKSGHKYIFL